MIYSTIVRSAAAATLLVGLLSPVFAFAQTPGNGLLGVYVQVVGQTQYNQYNQYTPVRVPSDFTVTVSGASPSPMTFAGSLSGTQVSLGVGSYSAALTGTLYGYTPAYSQGCSGTIAANQTSLCVVTLSAPTAYPYGTSYPYQYPTTPQPLTCTPAYQTVALGAVANFNALGGSGAYNWSTPSRTFLNIGPTLNTSLSTVGTQSVVVTSNGQSATCQVNVVASGYAGTTYSNTTYNTSPYLTYTYYPRLPNTGFAPQSAAQVAFAVVLLIASAIATGPYVRQVFALAVR